MNIIFFLFSLLFTTESSNFEGIIVYHTVHDNGRNDIEYIYFSQGKLRFETESFHMNEVKTYSSIYDFTDSLFRSYYSEDGGPYEVNVPSGSPSKAIKKYKEDSIISVLGLKCSFLQIEHEDSVFFEEMEAHFLHKSKVYLAENLRFKVPKSYNMERHMVLSFDDRIALRMDFESSVPVIGASRTYTREAVAILPMKLPPQVFEIK